MATVGLQVRRCDSGGDDDTAEKSGRATRLSLKLYPLKAMRENKID